MMVQQKVWCQIFLYYLLVVIHHHWKLSAKENCYNLYRSWYNVHLAIKLVMWNIVNQNGGQKMFHLQIHFVNQKVLKRLIQFFFININKRKALLTFYQFFFFFNLQDWIHQMKEIIVKCYSFHKSVFLLRFCNDLATMERESLRFINNYNSTTSLFDRSSNRLLVTFRNENMVSVFWEVIILHRSNYGVADFIFKKIIKMATLKKKQIKQILINLIFLALWSTNISKKMSFTTILERYVKQKWTENGWACTIWYLFMWLLWCWIVFITGL